MKRLCLEVPASTANLGPGFDTLGMALDIVDVFHVDLDEAGEDISIVDPEASNLDLDEHDNLLCAAYRLWAERERVQLPGARFTIESRIPIGRGLGSSAAAIVAGLSAAAHAAGEKNANSRILCHATSMEGHPDNVSAALLGGLTTAFSDGTEVHALHVANHLSLGVGLFIPNDPLLTADARAALPKQVSMQDAVHDLGRLAYLITALSWGAWDRIGPAMENRLHHPYRALLLPHLDTVITAARGAGAFGATLSGGGPTVIALGPADRAEAFTAAMEHSASENGWQGRGLVTRVRQHGVQIKEDAGQGSA